MQDRVDQLEKELAMKEAQIVAMQKQGAAGGSGGGGSGASEPSKESLDDFVCQFKDEVAALKDWLMRRGYAQREMVRRRPLPCCGLLCGELLLASSVVACHADPRPQSMVTNALGSVVRTGEDPTRL